MDGFEKRLKEIDESLDFCESMLVKYPQCKEQFDRMKAHWTQERADLANQIGRKKCR